MRRSLFGRVVTLPVVWSVDLAVDIPVRPKPGRATRLAVSPSLARARTWLRPKTSALLAGLAVLFAVSGSLRATEAYVATNPNDAKTEPPLGGGNGWLGGANVGLGATVNAGQTIWIACRNSFQQGIKPWDIKMTSTGLPADIGDMLVIMDGNNAPMGFDPAGKAIKPQVAPIAVSDLRTGIQKFHASFDPCPEWERIAIKNTGNVAHTFTIEAKHDCTVPTIAANTMHVESLIFGAETGGTPTNQYISQILVFPATVALDYTAVATFSAPPTSGNWTATPVFTDPDGTNRPLGGFQFTSDGPGLDSSQSCSFSFAMQGAAADLQYTMYAYDEVAQEFQQFALDLHPSLTISGSNNNVSLQFNSFAGLNYELQSSTDFQTWRPQQTFTGTGGIIYNSSPMDGPMGFFRLQCVPAPPNTNPPTLSTVTADAGANSVVLSFSEPVDNLTATNPDNYFVGSEFGPIPILNVSQIWSRAVELNLGTPLAPGGNYFLGIHGVTDQMGIVITPTTLQFAAVTLQNPCPGGTLLVQQCYSECNPDGFWHVVEDDWYQCPDSSTQKFRVADTKTTQRCGTGSSAPNPAGLLYPTASDVATTCQSPVLLGQVQIRDCVGGLWSLSTYLKYQCLDGKIYLSGPVQNVPMNPATTCDQPPPPMPAP